MVASKENILIALNKNFLCLFELPGNFNKGTWMETTMLVNEYLLQSSGRFEKDLWLVLYENVKRVVTDHLYQLLKECEKLKGEDLFDLFFREKNKYDVSISKLPKVCIQLDRYIRRNRRSNDSVFEIQALGLTLWKEIFIPGFKKHTPRSIAPQLFRREMTGKFSTDKVGKIIEECMEPNL